MIDPKSSAGILLREHDSIEQALAYAERKAKFLGAMSHGAALDYEESARQLRAEIARRQQAPNVELTGRRSAQRVGNPTAQLLGGPR